MSTDLAVKFQLHQYPYSISNVFFKNKSNTSNDFPQILKKVQSIIPKTRGVHSSRYMEAAGFTYTGDGDEAHCEDCGLKVASWTREMIPFSVHAERRPDCIFVRCLMSTVPISALNSNTALARSTSVSSEPENPSKRQKTETIQTESALNTLFETDFIQKARKRTFSHWPQRNIPSAAQMMEAGFFNCNVGDRVICLYCNLICQQWTPHTDDPCEVHKTLSKACIYVKAKLIRPPASTIIIVNGISQGTTAATNPSSTASQRDSLRSHEIVYTAACNPDYIELPRRDASFALWPNENLPSVDDLVRAGFFYTGTKTIVTCFYCNGSLQNWGPSDNPMIEHARWFPHCPYAKQLCGDDIYRKVQESKRAQQGQFERVEMIRTIEIIVIFIVRTS
jgi:hypothetical protein